MRYRRPLGRTSRLVRACIPSAGLLLALACSPIVLWGQEAKDEWGIWFMYFGRNRIADKSSIHSELQLRYWELGQNYNQFLLRLGYNYDINSDNMASGGYAFIDTSPFLEGEGVRDENQQSDAGHYH